MPTLIAVAVANLRRHLEELAPSGFKFELEGVVPDNISPRRINVYVADSLSMSMVPAQFSGYRVHTSIWTRA